MAGTTVTGGRLDISALMGIVPLPSLSINDVSVTEGNSGTTTATFTVTLSPAATNIVSVNYSTANGTAVSTSDYAATSGTLTFAVGETTKTIVVTINGDTTAESNETLLINLSAASSASIADSQGVATIMNDDVPPQPTISIADVSFVEGNKGSKRMTFTVGISSVSTQSVTVQYVTANGTASAGSDYTSTSGTVTIAAGNLSATINVSVKGDRTVELNETLFLNLSGPVNATFGDNQAVGTIVNDDGGALGFPSQASTIRATLIAELQGLIDEIGRLILPAEQQNSLIGNLTLARGSIGQSDLRQAARQINTAISQIYALQRSRRINTDIADPLIGDLSSILSTLNDE